MHRNDFASISPSGLTVRSALLPWPVERRSATAHNAAVHAALRIARPLPASMAPIRILLVLRAWARMRPLWPSRPRTRPTRRTCRAINGSLDDGASRQDGEPEGDVGRVGEERGSASGLASSDPTLGASRGQASEVSLRRVKTAISVGGPASGAPGDF